ncbi:alpha/beta hydrolase [Amycolatopsis roodepoortensis]|uniref:Acetyl esterase/lipase n=1 Tax=Amycolatopsis roodepoortensis TaxID=700274 RepID=A0ABR9LAP8_9PSEU|nr:alpha/beta hydrolase [Amycolatopsis roodepoortensis]MBE1577487.1 acetyl esterase/lipase [Amycolatopsis roodepoortensis]
MTYAYDPEIAPAVPLLPKLDLADLPATREQLKAVFAERQGVVDETGVTIREERVPGPEGAPDVRVRIYTPDRISAPAAIFDVHGGGFVIGDLEIDHAANVRFAREIGVVVVSVDYRLAPEAPYPAALEDCYAALTWVAKNAAELGVDPGRIAIHGISAGGGLCAALALLARDRGGPAIAFQYLGVPEVDDRLETPSMRAFVDTPQWNKPRAEISWDCYLGKGVRGTADVPVHAAPARAVDLSGLPPAYVSVMEFDPLRDEGIAYAQALLASGVTTELHLFPGTFHGSSTVEHAAVSKREVAEAITVLARALEV